MLRIVIIEDEKHIAQELKSVLRMIDDEIEVVNILSSVSQALEFFATEKGFDLIFSDIQLTDGLSFDIFKKIKLSVPVIFCTAYDKYALEAFKTNSIDYVLKPFDKESIAKSLEKYQQLKNQFSSFQDKLTELLQNLGIQPLKSQTNQAVIVHQGDKIIPVNLSEIALFYYEDEYVFALSFELKKHILTQSLDELEKVCGTTFFRANRQYLVNRKTIKDVSRHFNRKLMLNLTINYPTSILVSRLKATALIEWLALN